MAAKRAFEMQEPKRLPAWTTRRKQSPFFFFLTGPVAVASAVKATSVRTGTGTPKVAGGSGPSAGKPRVAR